MGRVLMELMKAREEYNRLLEMERTAAPEYVDVITHLIIAQQKRLEILRRELEQEVERLKRENRMLREGQSYWHWKAWAERTWLRRLDL